MDAGPVLCSGHPEGDVPRAVQPGRERSWCLKGSPAPGRGMGSRGQIFSKTQQSLLTGLARITQEAFILSPRDRRPISRLVPLPAPGSGMGNCTVRTGGSPRPGAIPSVCQGHGGHVRAEDGHTYRAGGWGWCGPSLLQPGPPRWSRRKGLEGSSSIPSASPAAPPSEAIGDRGDPTPNPSHALAWTSEHRPCRGCLCGPGTWAGSELLGAPGEVGFAEDAPCRPLLDAQPPASDVEGADGDAAVRCSRTSVRLPGRKASPHPAESGRTQRPQAGVAVCGVSKAPCYSQWTFPPGATRRLQVRTTPSWSSWSGNPQVT